MKKYDIVLIFAQYMDCGYSLELPQAVLTRSPALATCETSQVLLAGVSGGFPGVLPFRPPIDWLVSMSEIILKGTLN